MAVREAAGAVEEMVVVLVVPSMIWFVASVNVSALVDNPLEEEVMLAEVIMILPELSVVRLASVTPAPAEYNVRMPFNVSFVPR